MEREFALSDVHEERRPLREAAGADEIETASQIGERLAEIRDLLGEQARRGSEVDRLDQELAEKRERLATLEAEVERLAQREREAKALALEAEVRSAETEELRTALNKAHRQVEGQRDLLRNQETEQRERVAALEAEVERLTERDRTAQALRLEVEVRTAEIEDLRMALSAERRKVERLRERVKAQAARAERARYATEQFVDALPKHRRRTALRLVGWLLRLRLRDVRTYVAIRRSGRFDARFYLLQYPDVAAAGENPIIHYIATGAAEGRSPNRDFEPAAYVESNPELAETGANPLLHQIRAGH